MQDGTEATIQKPGALACILHPQYHRAMLSAQIEPVLAPKLDPPVEDDLKCALDCEDAKFRQDLPAGQT